jgi:hypothetical protein
VKLWGGNYSADPDKQFWEFNRSFGFDRRLLAEEIQASRAYARALGRCGAIPEQQAERLDQGLAEVLANAHKDPRYLELDAEDVHSFVETRLGEVVGELAGQGHLGRSRNEQAPTALRLWIRGAIDGIAAAAARLVETLAEKGSAGADAVMPGYTHIRAAEPITFGHLAAAHAWALVRDRERLLDARRRVNVLPLGSGALAGTALPARPRRAGARARLRGRVRERARRGDGPRFRGRVRVRERAAADAPGTAQRGPDLALGPRVRLLRAARRVHDRLLPDAAEEEPRLAGADPRQGGARGRRPAAAAVPDERPPRRVPEGPAGGQGGVFDAADTTAISLGVMTGVVAGL